MRAVLKNPQLRRLFAANSVSMIGSGMNSAAVIWYMLQATHSEQVLSALVLVQAIPPLLLMPFSGVIIDREDRRYLAMALDAARGLIILSVAVLCFRGTVQVWHLFAMSVLVSTGFWMFWPVMTALLQEITPEDQFAQSNGMLMAGFQGGWLIAGAVVGFMYEKIGIGGILLIDACTYVFSLYCYSGLRQGRHVVHQQHSPQHMELNAVQRFIAEMREGYSFVSQRISIAALGVAWATFTSAMMLASVITAPISDRILHAGAVGYGWLNAGWGTGAFVGSLATAAVLTVLGWKKQIPLAMLALALVFGGVVWSTGIVMAISLYWIGGVARGLGGVAITTSIMSLVPKHYMGRVQNLFAIFAIALQVALAPIVGRLAHTQSLGRALSVIVALYVVAMLAAMIASACSRVDEKAETTAV